MGAGAEEEGAPGAPWDQTESAGGTGAGHGIVYGGMTGIAAGFGTAAGDARAETVVEWLGWRTGLGAAACGVGGEAGMWTGWFDVAGGAER